MDGRIRSRRSKFAMVSNSAIDSLDPVSLWIYVKMYSKANIPDFKLYKKNIEQMAKDNGVGRDRFSRSWSLLIKKGYIKQYRLKNEKGHFYYEYEVLEEPEAPEEPDPKIVEEKKEEKQVKKKAKPKKEPAHPGEPVVPSPVHRYPCTRQPHTGNLPPINNTRDNNTRINNILSSSTSPSCNQKEEEEVAWNQEWYENTVPLTVRADKAYSGNAVLETVTQTVKRELTVPEQRKIVERASAAYKRRERSAGDDDRIKKPFSYFLALVEASALNDGADQKQGQEPHTNSNNRFHNFHQREYDFDQLEKDLLMAQW